MSQVPDCGTNDRMKFTNKDIGALDGVRILSRAARTDRYSIKLADSPDRVRAAQILRFLVFNLELNEGLETSFDTLIDADEFDSVCDHLIVEERATGEVVGTYRLQSGVVAQRNIGYYSASEFDLSPFEPVRSQTIELGRACVHRAHRNLAVLGLLWRGIIDYASERDARYLIGCSSLSSQKEDEGIALYQTLKQGYLADAQFITRPLETFRCESRTPAHQLPEVKPPKLLSAYLALGARICGEPAIDRQFKTIDFLTFLDIHDLDPRVMADITRS